MNEQQVYVPSPAPIRSQEQIDADNLGTLMVCHYVAGIVTAVYSCMFLIHITIGLVMIHYPGTFMPHSGTASASNPPLPFNPGYFFLAIGCIALTLGWTSALLNILAAKHIKQRKNYVFVLVSAGLNCVFMNALTTTLGVFTFVILLRPTVKALFEDGFETVRPT